MDQLTTIRGGRGAPKKIKIVDTRERLVDVGELAPDLLDRLLDDVAAARSGPDEITDQGLKSIAAAAERLRALRDLTAPDPDTALDEVRVRRLFGFSAVRPDVMWPPERLEKVPGALRVRAPKRLTVRASEGHQIAAVATEEPMQVVGLRATAADFGGELLTLFGAPRLAVTRWKLPVAAADQSPVIAAVAAARSGQPLVPDDGQLHGADPAGTAALRQRLATATDLATRAAAPAQPRPSVRRKAPVWPAPPKLAEWAGRDAAVDVLARLSAIFPLVAPADEHMPRVALLSDMKRVGALGLFLETVASRGANEADAARFFDDIAAQAAADRERRRLDQAAFEALARARILMRIVESRLSTERARAVRASLPAASADSPRAVLSALKPAERRVVEGVYAAQLRSWEAQAGNPCKHVDLAFRLRRAATARESLRLLGQLSEYFAPEPGSTEHADWIVCRSCQFQVICPHVVELTKLRAAFAPHSKVADRMARFAGQHAEKGRTVFSDFCRICSERLTREAPDSRRRGRGGLRGPEDGLRRALWAEAHQIAPRVRFPELVDPARFAGELSGVALPVLLQFEAERPKPRRARRTEESRAARRREEDADDPFAEIEEVSPQARLDAAIVSAAFVLNLVRSSPTVGFEGVRPGGRLKDYAEAALTYVAKSRSVLVSRAGGTSPEWLAERFRAAYKLIVARAHRQVLTVEDREMAFVQDLVDLDPTYRYAVLASRVSKATPALLPRDPEKRIRAAAKEFRVAFGGPPESAAALTPAELGSAVVRGALGIDAKGRPLVPRVVRYPPGSEPEFVQKSPGVNLFGRLFRPPAAAEKTPFVAEFALFRRYVVDTFTRAKFREYRRALERARAAAAPADRKRRAGALKSWVSFGFGSDTRRFGAWKLEGRRPSAGLPTLFDEDGRRHTWATASGLGRGTVLVFERGGDRLEVPEAEVRARRTSHDRPLHGFRLVDLRCGTCGALRSEVSKLDGSKVAAAVAARSDFAAFFAFYRSRCPEGGLHELDAGRCAKCGISTALVSGSRKGDDAAAARRYFKKYAATFRRRAQEKDEIAARAAAKPETEPASPQTPAGRATYKFDFSAVAEGAAAAGIPGSILLAIGATEQRDFDDVVSGSGAPPPPTTYDDNRIVAADAAARELASTYNQLRFVSRFVRPREEAVELLQKAGVPPSEYPNLPKLLPDVAAGYARRRDEIAAGRSPEDLLNFTVEAIARMLSGLAATGGPAWASAAAKLFAKSAGERILRGGKLLSANRPFDFRIFGDARAEGDPADDQVGFEAQDEVELPAGDDPPPGQFSLEGVDLGPEAMVNLE